MHKRWSYILAVVLVSRAFAQSSVQSGPATYPSNLPGNGLAQHDFLYDGEFETRKPVQTIWLIKGGQVAWSYSIPTKDAAGVSQELDNAALLPNGNVLFCRKTGASEVTPDKKIVWNYDAPPGTEVHVVEPMPNGRVMLVENGDPAKLKIIDTATNTVEKEFILPTGKPKMPHGQFRSVHVTAAGTFLASHMDMGKVSEYDADGKEIWTVKAPGAWDARRLPGGNTLISCQTRGVREVDPSGKIVWQFTQKDSPNIKLFILQDAIRLANGNTVITSWCPLNVKNTKDWPGTVQVIEVTPDKQIAWALASWTDPADLGPASGIQILDVPVAGAK